MFSIRTILFPERCRGCTADDCIVCAACEKHLAAHWTNPPRTQNVRSMLRYDDRVIQRLLHTWKYRGDKEVGTVLLQAFERGLASLPAPEHTCIVPIPTRRRNNNKRGFAPPDHLANAAAHVYGCPVLPVLSYARRTQRQAKLTLAKRKENMHNAFVIREAIPCGIQSVILIDDVVTSGATLAAAAHALTQNGVTDIRAITLAWNP